VGGDEEEVATMASTFQIEVVTPERQVVKQNAESAQIPGKDGYLGILPDHAALLSELGEGELSFTLSGKTEKITVSGGYVEVRNNHVRVLADNAK
jgi:F-type H+-transporting ATPase subunit epsilon